MSLVLRVMGVAVGIVTTSLLAKYLEPAGYGVLALAISLGTAAAQIADLGVAQAVASRIAREREHGGAILGTGLVLRTIVAVIATAALVGAALAGVFGAPSHVIAIVGLATPLSAAAVLTAGATARFRPEVAGVLAVFQGLAWLGAVWLTARAGGDVRTLAWCFVGVVVLQTGVSIAMNRKVVPLGRPSAGQARRILALSWPLAISTLAVTAYYRLDSLILFNAKGAGELGFYSAAYKLLDVAQLAPGVLVAPLLPLAASSIGMSPRHRELILSLATRTGAVVGVGCALVLVTLAAPLIGFLFGAEFAPAVAPLRFLALAFVGVTAGWVGMTICNALGRVLPIAMLTVPVAVISLGAQLWVAPRWGATGAAAVTALTELVVGSVSCLLAARAMAARLPLRQLASTVGIGVVIVLAAHLVELPPVLEAGAGAVAFGLAILAARVITIDDVRRVLSRRVL